MTKGPGVPKKKQPKKAAESSFDVCDGGSASLDLSAPAVSVRVTDRTTGAVIDPAGYVVDGSQVRKVAGVWARGRGRWVVEHDRSTVGRDQAAEAYLVPREMVKGGDGGES